MILFAPALPRFVFTTITPFDAKKVAQLLFNTKGNFQDDEDTAKKVIYNNIKNEDFQNLGNKASIDRTSKKYLIELHGEKCMKCGWDEKNIHTNIVPVQLNHIDGNPENHDLKNTELLCPNCHSLTEYFGRRGKGRKDRYKNRQ